MRNSSQYLIGGCLTDDLSDVELTVLETIVIINNSATTPNVIEALGISRRGAQKLLSRLIEKGVVERTARLVARATV